MNRTVDQNQQQIIDALRSIGCTVQDLSQLGRGCPNVLIGYRGRNFLLEIKSGDRVPKLTPREEQWIRQWDGQVGVITSIEDALAIVREADYEDATDRSK